MYASVFSTLNNEHHVNEFCFRSADFFAAPLYVNLAAASVCSNCYLGKYSYSAGESDELHTHCSKSAILFCFRSICLNKNMENEGR